MCVVERIIYHLTLKTMEKIVFMSFNLISIKLYTIKIFEHPLHTCGVASFSHLQESTYSPSTRFSGTSTSSIRVHWKKTAPGAQTVSPRPCRPVPRGGNSKPFRQSGLSQPMSVELHTGIGFMVHSEPGGQVPSVVRLALKSTLFVSSQPYCTQLFSDANLRGVS